MKNIIKKVLRQFGYEIFKTNDLERNLADFGADFLEIYKKCKPHTMTSIERMYALYQGVNYVIDNNIPGDFVECGVWEGGSSMVIAFLLKQKGISNRRLFMYDTFEGMAEPTELDRDFKDGSAKAVHTARTEGDKVNWCYATLDLVRQNMVKTGLDLNQIVFVKGKVEDTIPGTVPEKISLLRLDTDWYESTKHELDFLYPILSKNGVLIVDDYGHWKGCRQAVDEFFEKETSKTLFNRIDYTGRLAIK